MLPSLDGDDLQPALYPFPQPSFAVDHLGQFAYRAPMKEGDGQQAHKTLVLGLAERAVYVIARVGAVEHDELFPLFGATLHDIIKGADVRVEAGTCILDVEDEDVRLFQLPGCGLLVLAVERGDGDACPGVLSVLHRLSGLGGAAEPVFGSKDLYDVYLMME